MATKKQETATEERQDEEGLLSNVIGAAKAVPGAALTVATGVAANAYSGVSSVAKTMYNGARSAAKDTYDYVVGNYPTITYAERSAERPVQRVTQGKGYQTYRSADNSDPTGSKGFAEALARRNRELLERDLASAHKQGMDNSEYAATKQNRSASEKAMYNRMSDRKVLARMPSAAHDQIQSALDDARAAGDDAQAITYKGWAQDKRAGRSKNEHTKVTPGSVSAVWAKAAVDDLQQLQSKDPSTKVIINPADKGAAPKYHTSEATTISGETDKVSTVTYSAFPGAISLQAGFTGSTAESLGIRDIDPTAGFTLSAPGTWFSFEAEKAPKSTKTHYVVNISYRRKDGTANETYIYLPKNFKATRVKSEDGKYYDVSFDDKGHFKRTPSMSNATAQLGADALSAVFTA